MQYLAVSDPNLPAVALDQVKYAYFLLDHDFCYVFFNREAERLTGVDRSKLLGRCVWDVYPEILGTVIEKEYRRVNTERVSSSFENRLGDRWFQKHVDPIDGGIIVGFHEITRQKQLQEELARSKDIVAMVSESGLIGSFRWSIQDDETVVSPEIYTLFGLEWEYTRKDSSFWFGRMHPEDGEAIAANLMGCIAGRKPSAIYEFRARQADDSYRWLQCRTRFRYDDDGRPLMMVGVTIDLSQRKELEEQLRRRVEELETLMDLAPVAIWVAHDPQCLNVAGNHEANAFLNAQPGENVSPKAALFYRDGMAIPKSALPLDQAASLNVAIQNSELTVLLPNGENRHLFGHASPLRNADGSARGAVGAFVDSTDLKRAEQELRVQKAQLEATFQALQTGVTVVDMQGNLILVNEAAAKMAGFSSPDEMRRNLDFFDRIFEFRSPEGTLVARDEWAVSKALRGERFANLERLGKRLDTGKQSSFSFSGGPVCDCAGRQILGVVVTRDITEEKRTAQALTHRIEDFETLLSVAPVGIAVSHDPECRDVRVNPALAALLGIDTKENASLSRPDADRLPFRIKTDGRELRPDELPQQIAAKTGQRTGTSELEVERADGSRRYLFGTAAPLFDEASAVRGTIAAFFDATDLRLADAKVRESHAQLKRLVDANIVGVGITIGSRVVESNDLYLDMLGYTRQDLEQGLIDWANSTPPEFLERSMAAFAELRERGCITPFEKEYFRRDGTRIPVMLGAAILASEPELTAVVLIIDLTAQKALEHELQTANQRLTRSNDELQRFAYVVAHDLQAPLRTVSTMTALLARKLQGKLDGDCLQMAGHIQNSASQMSALIADLLDYSTLSMDAPAPLRPIDCALLFSQTLANLQSVIAETGAKVDGGPLPKVRADDQLIRVFQNLIENAIKYRSERPPEVHVAAERDGVDWKFSVRDNGIGLEMRHAERIFGVFQRLHSAHEYKGTGIGLATCRKLMERYGGRLSVHSQPGVGSTFYFTIPADPALDR